jgi:hypothetical protein
MSQIRAEPENPLRFEPVNKEVIMELEDTKLLRTGRLQASSSTFFLLICLCTPKRVIDTFYVKN